VYGRAERRGPRGGRSLLTPWFHTAPTASQTLADYPAGSITEAVRHSPIGLLSLILMDCTDSPGRPRWKFESRSGHGGGGGGRVLPLGLPAMKACSSPAQMTNSPRFLDVLVNPDTEPPRGAGDVVERRALSRRKRPYAYGVSRQADLPLRRSCARGRLGPDAGRGRVGLGSGSGSACRPVGADDRVPRGLQLRRVD
jgi:hypothetical protein